MFRPWIWVGLVASMFGSSWVLAERGQQEPGADTDEIKRALTRVAAVRQKIGGEANLANVKSLVIQGTRRARNEWFKVQPEAKEEFLTQALDIRILLPDHFLERRSSPSTVRKSGFAGTTLLNALEGAPGVTTKSFPAPNAIDAERRALAMLALALLLRTDSAFPLSVAGIDGNAIRFQGGKSTTWHLEIDAGTELPQRVHWQAGGMPIEIRLSDYRPVGTLLLPHRLVTMRKGIMQSDAAFYSIEINPPLTSDAFTR